MNNIHVHIYVKTEKGYIKGLQLIGTLFVTHSFFPEQNTIHVYIPSAQRQVVHVIDEYCCMKSNKFKNY